MTRLLSDLWRLAFGPRYTRHRAAVRSAAVLKVAKLEQRQMADNDSWAVQQYLDRYRNTGAV